MIYLLSVKYKISTVSVMQNSQYKQNKLTQYDQLVAGYHCSHVLFLIIFFPVVKRNFALIFLGVFSVLEEKVCRECQ